MTQGNPGYGNDIYRSLPADLTERLRRELPGEVVDLSPASTGAKDFSDTAAIIDTLDLVVSVDTSVAHLAGALGKPVYILSRFDGCWRWLQGRDDTPWYPSARLFRQPRPGDWTSPLDSLRKHIVTL